MAGGARTRTPLGAFDKRQYSDMRGVLLGGGYFLRSRCRKNVYFVPWMHRSIRSSSVMGCGGDMLEHAIYPHKVITGLLQLLSPIRSMYEVCIAGSRGVGLCWFGWKTTLPSSPRRCGWGRGMYPPCWGYKSQSKILTHVHRMSISMSIMTWTKAFLHICFFNKYLYMNQGIYLYTFTLPNNASQLPELVA